VFRYRLLLEYEGTAYLGWQRQPHGPTIQSLIEDALERVLGGNRVSVTASGRTDSGVHALGQVVSFVSPVERSARSLCLGVNTLLPPDISCRVAAPVDLDFHPIQTAVGKHYRYRVLDRNVRAPLRRTQVLHVHEPVELERVCQAAEQLLGTHDFTTFRAQGCASRSAVKTVTRIDVHRVGDEVHFDVEGTGFLRHMVRAIVGTLLQVSTGRFEPTEIATMLAARDRSKAGKTAPAHGLTLVRVHYPDAWPHPV